MLLLYRSYKYINKQNLFLKLSRGSWVEGRGGRGGFRDTLNVGPTHRGLIRHLNITMSVRGLENHI